MFDSSSITTEYISALITIENRHLFKIKRGRPMNDD